MSIFSNIAWEELINPSEAPDIEMTHSITPSLLNAFLYFQSSKEERREEAEISMLETLSKTPFTNDAMSRGIEFEDLICKVTEGTRFEDLKIEYLKEFERPKLESIIKDIAEIVADGSWQVAKKTPFKSKSGEIFQLSSKFDVQKPGIIYDIKYTGKKRPDKFRNSVQHRIYMYQTGISKFAYLISDGKKWWREDYYRDSANDGDYIGNIINDFLTWLGGNAKAASLYREKWKVKPPSTDSKIG